VVLSAGLAACGGDSNPSPDARPTAEEIRSCLERAGLRVTFVRRHKDDLDAPDVELIVRGRRTGAFIGYYEQEARARKLFPSVERNMERAGGTAQLEGTVGIGWVRGRRSPAGRAVVRCVRAV
jgi:protein tyrosine phosphatase (PTP) superfamily phosphohydrolase (DUF442 family)